MNKIKKTVWFLTTVLWFLSLSAHAVTAPQKTKSVHHAPVKHTRPVQHTKAKRAQPVHHAKHRATHQRKSHVLVHRSHTHAQSQPNLANLTPAPSPSLFSSWGTRMVQFVHSTISSLRYSAYKLGGTHFDNSKGIYIVDCSDYVDHLLAVSNPLAYHSLVHSTGSDKPTTAHYYDFFTGLTYQPKHYWNKVDFVKELQPGDILVFRNTRQSHTGVGGHVMVVMNKPTKVQNTFMVRVTDSASSGHSQDTRLPHTSGIGIGTMQIQVNPETGEPSGYAWKLGSTIEHHVNFAMARPVE